MVDAIPNNETTSCLRRPSLGKRDDYLQTLEDDDPFNAVGCFLATHFYPREWCEFDIFALGGFNICFRMVFTDNTTAIIRFPFPGIIMFPEEKVHNEVRAMQFILEQT
ncbi:Aminoglycoside phosphotransferase [Penicillium viridicatum]|nr:Aminoglycoside phosphotransferase [Penicillium viridicatum]